MQNIRNRFSIPPFKLNIMFLSRCSLSVQGFEEVIPFEYHDGYLTIHFEVRRRKEYVAPVFSGDRARS